MTAGPPWREMRRDGCRPTLKGKGTVYAFTHTPQGKHESVTCTRQVNKAIKQGRYNVLVIPSYDKENMSQRFHLGQVLIALNAASE